MTDTAIASRTARPIGRGARTAVLVAGLAGVTAIVVGIFQLANERATGGKAGFTPPTVGEFFPGTLLFDGMPFAMTRINLIGLFMTGLLALFFVSAFSRTRLVPRGVQNIGEALLDLVRVNIVDEVLGHKGHKYIPLLTTMFFMIFAFNITGVLPLFHLSATSVIGVPLLLAVVSYIVFNVEGIRANGLWPYLKANLFPPGVPAPIYVLVTPIEFIGTFLLRPVTLTIRLLANMMSGHMLLVLFFGATSFFLLDAASPFGFLGAIPSFIMGFAFVLFEVLVALLQAYIFTLLTAVYLDSATSAEH
jgi:F-type H+-transporting ATPase subunit a